MVTSKILSKTVVEEMEFDGDILITDPCYVLDMTGNGVSGSYPRIQHSTLYGDWSCHVWKASEYSECTEDNVIGQFCADGGMVMVADWKAVKQCCPNAEQWVKDHDWCATVIKDFKGTVKMIKIEEQFTYEDDWEPDETWGHKKGDVDTDAYLELFGIGSINWIAAQTGL